MKKITSKKLSNRLLQYGAMSAAALGVAEASGQVVYTDVSPDQVIAVGGDFIIDMNSDGIPNLTPSNPSGLAGGNAAIVFPSAGGAFVGVTAGGFEYPALLASGDIIDDASGYTATGVRGDLNYYGCAYANSQWCATVTDGYLGVRFTFSGNTYYGWVRMDTDVNGSNLMTIKDFAYESTPNVGIQAGDMGTIVGFEDNIFNNFTYFVDANNSLNLRSATAMQSVTINSLLGQQVSTQKLSSNNENVSLASLTTGIYLATVTIDGATKTVKILKK